MHGQTAFEYLMIFSIVFIILTILIVYSQQITLRNREEMRITNAITAVNKIVDAADIVFTQGSPSQLTVSIYIPEGVDSIQINNNIFLIKIRVAGEITDIFAISKTNLQGSISTDPGTKKVKVIAEENYVNITEG